VQLVVQNESPQPWRLRSLQATPTLAVKRIFLSDRRVAKENRSYQDQDDIRVEGRQRVEFTLTDMDATGPLRFALLHEGMGDPDGTILTFTWNWKDEAHQEKATLEHSHEADQQLHDQRRLAVKVEANVCRIFWGSFTYPLVSAEGAAGAGAAAAAGAGSGSGSAAPVGLPIGTAGKGPVGAGAGAGADRPELPRPVALAELVSMGAGSQSALPTGPSTEPAHLLRRLGSHIQQKERGTQAGVESKAPVESKAALVAEVPLEPKLYTGDGRVSGWVQNIHNSSASHPYRLALRKAAEASSYQLAGPDGLAAGGLDEVVTLPPDSWATLRGVYTSPVKPEVVLERADGTQGEAVERFVHRPQGGTPSRDGRSPLRLYRVDDGGKVDAAPRTFVHMAGPKDLVIKDYEQEAGGRLDESLLALALYGPDTAPSARSQAPAAQEPDVAPLPSAGDPAAQSEAGAMVAVESKQAATSTAGAGVRGGDTDIPDTASRFAIPALGLDTLAALDLELVTGDDASAQDAVNWFLFEQSHYWHEFNLTSQVYRDQIVESLRKVGFQDWGKAEAPLPLLQVCARYWALGGQHVKETLEACLADWESFSKSDWPLSRLRPRVFKMGNAWLSGRVQEAFREALENLPDGKGSSAGAGGGSGSGDSSAAGSASAGPGTAGSGSGSGSGAGAGSSSQGAGAPKA
jgi:hypothetical protein